MVFKDRVCECNLYMVYTADEIWFYTLLFFILYYTFVTFELHNVSIHVDKNLILKINIWREHDFRICSSSDNGQ